jgi:multisubunit Na+/H+ antiporter MnhB subunit
MNQTGGGLSGGAIVGIVFGIILIVGFIWFKTNSGRPLNEAELAAGVMEKQDWGGSSPQIK